MKLTLITAFMLSCLNMTAGNDNSSLKINESDYFERQGVNVLVFSNNFNGGFNDEKNSGIEIIQHGVRIAQGGAIRLNKTPEQWDLVPKMVERKVNRERNEIEVRLRYDDYDFESRVVASGHGESVRIDVYLDTILTLHRLHYSELVLMESLKMYLLPTCLLGANILSITM